MLTRTVTNSLLAFIVVISGPAWTSEVDMTKSYAELLAKSYAELFAPVQGAGAGKALHLITPEAFLDKVTANEPLVVLDVRTPAETDVYGMTLPGRLMIPINELFSAANLARIPTDKTVVILCLSGTRSTAAGTALRHIGFDNVYILKGGYRALVAYLDPKKANAPLEPATSKK